MKKILIFISLLFQVVLCSAQYPTALPSSGSISIQQISNWMLAAGEISANNYSISYLNSKSHLADKTAPYSLSDWRGYTPACFTPSISSVSFSGTRSNGIYVKIVGVVGTGKWSFLVSFNTGYPSNQNVSFTDYVTSSGVNTLVGSGFPGTVTINNFQNVSSCGVSTYAGGWSSSF